MNHIERVTSNAPWEPIFGYVRKVIAGNWLMISGTTAIDERGMIVGTGQMYVQARQVLLNLKNHIESAGFSLADVIRTRILVTDISRSKEVARAHKEMFGENPPASTLVEVSRLLHPDMMIEIEVDAFRAAKSASEAMPHTASKKKRVTPSRAKPKSSSQATRAKASKPQRRR
jgi:enamine deaminase RidA (YjgF/YER057c/UK114 family)